MTKKTQFIAIHILGCVAFLMLPIIAYPHFDEFENPFLDDRFPQVMCKQIVLLLFFYLNYYYFLPQFYFKKKLVVLGAAVAVSLAVILIIGDYLPIKHPTKNEPPRSEIVKKINNRNPDQRPNGIQLNRTEYTVIQFCFIFIISIFFKNTKRLEALHEEKIKTELSYLKAQINPHFLFNTLNSLYALTLEKSDDAPNAVLKLSGLMRYVVTDSSKDLVPLEKEINYLNDYIELQKLRMGSTVTFLYTVTGALSGQTITPLLLIPFIENAFKYGINPEEKCEISITIAIDTTNLELTVINKIVVKSTLDDALKSEKGLESCLKRLNFIYPNKHSLVLKNDHKMYTVLLKLQLA